MISISKADELKKVIDSVSSFISEANLRFNEQGISLKAVDQSQIALVDFLIPKKSFEIFKIEPCLLGINLEELNKVLQRINPTDKIELNLREGFFEINILDEMKRKFTLPLIDVNETELELPKVKYDFELTIPARLLKESLKDAGLFSSSVLLKVKQNKLIIEAEGTQGNIRALINPLSDSKFNSTKELEAKFSLSFLSSIFKACDLNHNVKIGLKADSPIRIEFLIDQTILVFYLAHMIL